MRARKPAKPQRLGVIPAFSNFIKKAPYPLDAVFLPPFRANLSREYPFESNGMDVGHLHPRRHVFEHDMPDLVPALGSLLGETGILGLRPFVVADEGSPGSAVVLFIERLYRFLELASIRDGRPHAYTRVWRFCYVPSAASSSWSSSRAILMGGLRAPTR